MKRKETADIPQFLRHEIKILGFMTGRQLLILLAAAGLSVSCWQQFGAVRPGLAILGISLIVSTAIICAFLRVGGRSMEEWLIVCIIWGLLPNFRGTTFQRTFQRVKHIDNDGLVELRRGDGYLALVEVTGEMIEQLENESSFLIDFTEFLSGISFPLSIHMRMHLSTFEEAIFTPTPDLPTKLRRLQAHYLSFLYEQIRIHPPRSLRCIVIIAAATREQCSEYVKLVLQTGLKTAGLSSRVLLPGEVMSFYHQESFGVREPEAARALAGALYIEGQRRQQHCYSTSLALSSLPGTVAVGWLAQFIQQHREPYDVLLHLRPADDRRIAAQLQRKAVQFGGALLVAQRDGHKKENSVTQYALKEVEELRKQLLLKKNHVYLTTMIVTIQSTSRTKLRARAKALRLLFRSLNIGMVYLSFQHHIAFLSSIYGQNLLTSYAHLLPTDAAASFYPFVQLHLWEAGKILLGTTYGGDLVSFDPDGQINSNLAVLGIPGSGKSFFLKLLSARWLFHSPERSISVIDIEGEYTKWSEVVDARPILFSANSLVLNPLELGKIRSLREKLVFLVGFFSLLVGEQGELSQQEQALVTKAALNAYREYGIMEDDEASFSQAVPTMRDLLNHLRALEAKEICYRLEMYIHLFPEASTATEEEAQQRVLYNLHDLPVSLRGPAMYLILERLSLMLHEEQPRGRHLLVIDEAWFLSRFRLGATFLNEFARRARKYGIGLWVGTQQVADLLTSSEEHFRGILDLCGTKVLFRQDPEYAGKLLKLNSHEEQFLRGAKRGSALYLTNKERLMVNILASPREDFARGANKS